MPSSTVENGYYYFVHDAEVWDAKKCEKAAKHTAKDGYGTKYPFEGFIGGCERYGQRRYNGGCIRNDEHYDGEILPLPIVADGFQIIHQSTWGYRIVKGYQARAAREAQETNYGDKVYWDHLEKSARELQAFFLSKGNTVKAAEMLTRSLADALRGNEGT